ncbi:MULTISPECIES: hypothetical protein [unclassified Phyllobacterium]|uniref:hypothetical protein n=1 Tax=unclassified Phyllobacterium TaxID=2638441 RepID=UPI00301302EA
MNMIRVEAKAPAIINPATAQLPASYENAKTALASCASIDECQSWADKAAALASYAKQANDGELMKMATRIRDRAIRRAGELLKQIEPAHGANQNIGAAADTKVLTRRDAAEQAGMSKRQQVTAIRVANVPEPDFERQVESANPPTVTKLAEQGKKAAPQPIIDLKGRDPGEFNKSMHFVQALEGYQRDIEAIQIGAIIPVLIDSERARVRKAIAAIDTIHDQIITRI